ncbi:MAG: SPFH domain-containing protein [Kineosporiaceae bacterium]
MSTPSAPVAGEPDVRPVAGPDLIARPAAGVDIAERPAWEGPGFAGLGLGVLLLLAALGSVIGAAVVADGDGPAAAVVGLLVLAVLAGIGGLLVLGGLTVIQPGQTRVVQFFGGYVGTARRPGLVWLQPLASRRNVQVRVRNIETARLKVNDADGNPVEIAAIIVWQVRDTAKAVFAVEDYQGFVAIQAEAAVRHVAGTYPYDAPETVESLRGSTDEVSRELAREVAARASVAGVEIVEVRISHLAYSPEIAQAMLQRQQAAAVVAARSKIVEGAVGMVQMALDELSFSRRRRRARRGAQGVDGLQPARRPVRRLAGHPHRQHRHPLPVRAR